MRIVRNWRKTLVMGTACLATAAIVVGVGMSPAADVAQAASDTQVASDATATDDEPTFQELIEMYPDEYESAMTHKTDEEGEDNSHAGFQVLIETPAERNSEGAIVREVSKDDPAYTGIAISCVSCKSSGFNDLFDEMGYDAFDKSNELGDEEFATLDGRYWDCYGCHTWEDGELTLSANMAYANEDIFPTLAAYYDSLDPEEAVCGQCHNVANARNFASDAETAAECNPYKYGLDMEDIYKALVEGGIYGTDEATGMIRVKENHPQIEIFQNSVHQSMGLTCVDCHMTQETDEDGNTYTSHNASGSVAENDAAMELCLTCHGNQDGLETVDDMRAWLKDKQDAQAERQAEVQEKLDTLYDLVLGAVESGDMDEDALQEAKDAWSLAQWFVWEQQGNLYDPADGAQIAHDPDELRQLLERADALADDAIALFA